MYHFIVKQKLRRAFTDINAGRHDRIVTQFAAEHGHVMYGNHALAGERITIAATAQWYLRLKLLLPDLCFEIHAVAVPGWPWQTVAVVIWNDHFTAHGRDRARRSDCSAAHRSRARQVERVSNSKRQRLAALRPDA